jgi:hypothetical protein
LEFANLEIAGAADRDRTGMAEGFPKPLRTRYRGGGSWAFDGFASDNAAIDIIEGHHHEIGELAHGSTSSLTRPPRRCRHRRRFGLFSMQSNTGAAALLDANQGRRADHEPAIGAMAAFISDSQNKPDGTAGNTEHPTSAFVVGAGNSNM